MKQIEKQAAKEAIRQLLAVSPDGLTASAISLKLSGDLKCSRVGISSALSAMHQLREVDSRVEFSKHLDQNIRIYMPPTPAIELASKSRPKQKSDANVSFAIITTGEALVSDGEHEIWLSPQKLLLLIRMRDAAIGREVY